MFELITVVHKPKTNCFYTSGQLPNTKGRIENKTNMGNKHFLNKLITLQHTSKFDLDANLLYDRFVTCAAYTMLY